MLYQQELELMMEESSFDVKLNITHSAPIYSWLAVEGKTWINDRQI